MIKDCFVYIVMAIVMTMASDHSLHVADQVQHMLRAAEHVLRVAGFLLLRNIFKTIFTVNFAIFYV